jgi:hypothetical protein
LYPLALKIRYPRVRATKLFEAIFFKGTILIDVTSDAVPKEVQSGLRDGTWGDIEIIKSMYRSLGALVVLLVTGLAATTHAADPLPKAVLYLDESSAPLFRPDSSEIARVFRENLKFSSPIAIYAENLGLNHFGGPKYEVLLHNYLQEKYEQRPIGLSVAMGASALRFALRSTSRWAAVPIVFGAIDADVATQIVTGAAAANVTGHTLRFSLDNSINAARALVPRLKNIALVGNANNNVPYRGHFDAPTSVAAARLNLIDLTGLPMSDIRAQVAELPKQTAIIYTAITTDGAGTQYLPYEALRAFAEAANCPIVVDIENRIGHGGTGGPIVLPALIGQRAAELATRIFNGEDASQMPVSDADAVRPCSIGKN